MIFSSVTSINIDLNERLNHYLEEVLMTSDNYNHYQLESIDVDIDGPYMGKNIMGQN